MLQKTGTKVTYCLERSSSALERAKHTNDADMRAFYEEQSIRWSNLAASAALADRVDLFLASLEFKKLQPADVCRWCNRRMRLLSVEVTSEGERHVFECSECGRKKTRRLHGH